MKTQGRGRSKNMVDLRQANPIQKALLTVQSEFTAIGNDMKSMAGFNRPMTLRSPAKRRRNKGEW